MEWHETSTCCSSGAPRRKSSACSPTATAYSSRLTTQAEPSLSLPRCCTARSSHLRLDTLSDKDPDRVCHLAWFIASSSYLALHCPARCEAVTASSVCERRSAVSTLGAEPIRVCSAASALLRGSTAHRPTIEPVRGLYDLLHRRSSPSSSTLPSWLNLQRPGRGQCGILAALRTAACRKFTAPPRHRPSRRPSARTWDLLQSQVTGLRFPSLCSCLSTWDEDASEFTSLRSYLWIHLIKCHLSRAHLISPQVFHICWSRQRSPWRLFTTWACQTWTRIGHIHPPNTHIDRQPHNSDNAPQVIRKTLGL